MNRSGPPARAADPRRSIRCSAVVVLLDSYGRPARVTVSTRDPRCPGLLNTMGPLLHRTHARRVVGVRSGCGSERAARRRRGPPRLQ